MSLIGEDHESDIKRAWIEVRWNENGEKEVSTGIGNTVTFSTEEQ